MIFLKLQLIELDLANKMMIEKFDPILLIWVVVSLIQVVMVGLCCYYYCLMMMMIVVAIVVEPNLMFFVVEESGLYIDLGTVSVPIVVKGLIHQWIDCSHSIIERQRY